MFAFPMQATTVIQHGKGVAAIRAGNSSLPGMLVRILREEGVRGLYKGLTAATAGAGPAHALYYAVYELTKKELGANRGGHRHFSVAAAGARAMPLISACNLTACTTPYHLCKHIF